MRKKRAKAAVAVVALAAAIPTAALAGGGGGFSVVIFGGTARGHSVTSEVEVSGSVTVDFHGDDAAGCAAAHLCDVVGSARWDPSGPGTLIAIGYRRRGKRFENGFMTFADDFEPGQLQTSARVRRSDVPGSLCADGVGQDGAESNSASRRGSVLELRLIDPTTTAFGTAEVLRTRCAGPTAADVAALLPARRVSERELLRGHKTLDFSVDRPFAAHGLAGTLHSDVVVRIAPGRRASLNSGSTGFPRGSRKIRKRTVTAYYKVERVSGQVVTSVRGNGDPDLCGPVDACGILGSITTSPVASSGTASISALASIRRSRGDLRRALGLASGPRPHGIVRYGDASWDRDGGSVTSELTRDGAPACSDSAAIAGGGGILLGFSGGRVRAAYGGDRFGGGDLVRTRCPGPGEGDRPTALASGSFPLSVFRHRRVTLRLARGAGYSSAAYSGRTTPDITVVLRRTSVRSSVFTESIPPDFPGGSSVRSLR